MKRLPIYISLLLLLTCAKEDNTSLIEGYQLQISQLNSKITEYSNQVTQLQSTVNSLNSQVNTIPGLEDTITSLNEQIGELEETIEALTSEVSVIPDLNDEITSLEETIASLNEQIESLELILNPIEVVKTGIDIPYTTMEYRDVYNAAMNVRNKVYYRHNNTDYILLSGGTNPNITGKLHGSPMLLKKSDGGEWEFSRTWNDIGMGGVRNTYQINPNTFLFSDAAEVPLNGTGIVREENHIYIAEVNGDNVNWTKIENDGYHHDASFGDLNNDGVLDIVSASQGEIYYGTGGYNFDIVFDKLPSRYGSAYFSNEIVDVDNDGIEEIIEVSYVGSSEDVKNGFRILKRNNEGNYELFKKNTTSQNNSKGRDVGGTWTESLDLNNNGNQDLIILSEGCVNGTPCAGGTLEIYFGDGQGNFNSNQLIDVSDLWLLTPNLLDIDFDGDKDIVFTAGSIGGDYKVSTGLRVGGGFNTGFRLDKLIYINQGNGNFNQYPKELINYNDSFLNSFNPFINKDGKLSFYGAYVYNREELSLSTLTFWEVTINNL